MNTTTRKVDKWFNIYLKLKNNGKKNFYHGKVFRINTENSSYILYGSSNCTLSALSKTYHDGGNIECNILEEGTKNDFDYFFDNFEIESFKELTCNILEYESKEKKEYSFKYGIRKDEIKLYLTYKNINNNIKVQFVNKYLKYEYLDKELLITIDKANADELNNIFDLIIKTISLFICSVIAFGFNDKKKLVIHIFQMDGIYHNLLKS